MKRQVITTSNDSATWQAERAKDVTSTESAALFGLSPDLTRFELFHRKRGNVPVVLEPNERMGWGLRLQDAIARGVASDHGWIAQPMREYVRLPEVRAKSWGWLQ